MKTPIVVQPERNERQNVRALRELANRALSRAAGAPLVADNHVRLLKDARENYPAWFQAIRAANHYVHFENYIIYEDNTGYEFADALIAKARDGVRVRLIYDWMGCFHKASRRFWNYLRAGGIEVRCYNPPRFDSPFGWLSRDHRKTLVVDGHVGFITGLCVGRMWAGEPEKDIEPWRDTGVEVRGPAVLEIDQAFAQMWAMMGDPIPEAELIGKTPTLVAGNMDVRIVASLPATTGMIRLDELVAALARERLWLTDAYYAATTTYVQALRAAAMDGVDVRLLLPNATDIPMLKLLSRAGYQPLLEAGVRVFEWNGVMLHAKTAVADEHWARVGSTNLNVASWFGNCELDAVIEDDSFAHEMKEMYLHDLANSTEIVLGPRHKLVVLNEPHYPRVPMAQAASAGRAAAGAIRVGHTLGAAFTNRRVLEPVEARIMLTIGVLLLAWAVLFACLPRLPAYTLAVLFAWIAMTLLYKAYKLHREKKLRALSPEGRHGC